MASGSWSPGKDMPDLQSKVAVVTGGSSGLGLHIVKHLASKGAKVYFTGRSKTKAEKAMSLLKSLVPDLPNDRVVWIKMDLTDMTSVLDAVEQLKMKETKLGILINNAGGTAHGDYAVTEAGWEMNMATNYVGHFLFTNGVLPLLKAAAKDGADVRIAMTSSSAVRFFLPDSYPLDFTAQDCLSRKNIHRPWKWLLVWRQLFTVDMVRYAIAKLALSVFAEELQRRLDADGVPILCASLDPGSVLSDDVLSIFVAPMRPLAQRSMVSVDQGSFNALYVTTSPELRQRSDMPHGGYFEPVGVRATAHPMTADEKQARGLWQATTVEVNRHLSESGLGQLAAW